jgi:hypothetical protein
MTLEKPQLIGKPVPLDAPIDTPTVDDNKPQLIGKPVPLDVETPTLEPKTPQNESTFDKFVTGAKRGIAETAAPFAVDKPHVPEDVESMVGHIFGSMGMDIAGAAAAAKTGAILGAPIPFVGSLGGGLAALAGYAIYSGFGQEKLHEKRGGEFSPTRAGGRALLSMNPMLRYGGKLSQHFLNNANTLDKLSKVAKLAKTENFTPRMARLGAQVAGETGVATTESAEMGIDPKVAAGLTAGVSVFLHGLAFKTGRKIDLATTKDIDNLLTPSQYDLHARATQYMAQDRAKNPQKYKIPWQEFENGEIDVGFASMVAQRKAGRDQSDTEQLKRQAIMYLKQNKENAQDLWELWRHGLAVNKVAPIIKNELANAAEKEMVIGKSKDGVQTVLKSDIGRTAKWLKDGHHLGQQADQNPVLGSMGATERLNRVSESEGIFNNVAISIIDKQIKYNNFLNRHNVSAIDASWLKLYQATGSSSARQKIDHLLDNDGNLGPIATQVTEQLDDIFNTMHSSVQTYGMGTTKIDHYLPRRTIMGASQDVYIEDAVLNIMSAAQHPKFMKKPNIARWSKDEITDTFGADAPDLLANIQDLRWLKGVSGFGDDLRVDKLLEFQSHLRKPAIRKNIEHKTIGAALERTKKDVSFSDKMREMDSNKLINQYMTSQVKPAIMAESLHGIKQYADVASLMGAPNTASWFNRLHDDLIGNRPDSWRTKAQSMVNEWGNAIERGMIRNKDTWPKYYGLKSTKMMLDWATHGWRSSMYPAVLGLNTASALRNATQPILQNAPMLGGTYGPELVLRSYTNKPTKHLERLRRDGIITEHATQFEAEAQLKGMAKKINDKLMLPFNFADKTNRVISYNMGHLMVDDILKGNKAAIQALKNSGAGTLGALKKNGIVSHNDFAKNRDKAGDIIGKMLVARTQFHYDAAQKAEIVRDLGPMLTMFSKWPMAMASEAHTLLKENPELHRKAIRYTERFILPTLLLAGADELLNEKSPPKRMWGELHTMSPIWSVANLGNFDANPTVGAINAVKESIVRANQNGAHALENGLKDVLRHMLKTGGVGPAGISSLTSAAINELGDRKTWRDPKDQQMSKEIVESLFK